MNQYDKVMWRGEPLTRRQRQALIATERAIQADGHRQFQFIVPQGSWQPQTAYSGTSHTQAGVCDLVWDGIAYDTRKHQEFYRYVLRQVRQVGHQASFGRGPWCAQIDGTGSMPLHLHTCDLDPHGEAETVRTFQVPQYRLGFDGLYAGHKDPFPFRPDRITKWRYR